HAGLLAQQRARQREERADAPARRGFVKGHHREEERSQLDEMARPRNQLARRFGEQRERGAGGGDGPGEAPPEGAVQQERAEREQHAVESGHGPGVGQDQGTERRVIDLVGERSPERRRSAAIEQSMTVEEERVVEEVEVVRDRLAERGAEALQEQGKQRGETRP